MGRFTSIALAALAWGGLFGSAAASAGDYPSKSIQIVVDSAPGGSIDVLARILGNKMTELLGQSVVVNNRPGGSNTMAGGFVAEAAPNGYTLLMSTTTHTIPNPDVKLTYDPIKSFEPICFLAVTPYVLATRIDLPAHDMKELIALAKSEPGKLKYGAGGAATPTNMAMLMLMHGTDTKMTNVNYRGGAPTLVGLLSGEIDLMWGSVAVLQAQSKAGKARAIAVNSLQRFPGLPDVPTVAEALNLPEFDGSAWFGLMAPAGTSKDIVATLNDAVNQALKDTDVLKQLSAQGYIPVGGAPEVLGDMMKKDIVKWTDLQKQMASD